MTDQRVTTKATGETTNTKSEDFKQLYSLDMTKELMPNLTLGGGFGFTQLNAEIKNDGEKETTKNTSQRPYVQLLLDSSNLDSVSSYGKNTIERGNFSSESSKRYTEEYIQTFNWKPVQLPESDFTYIRNLAYNEPTSQELKLDRQSDLYQLETRYDYKNYSFNYIHSRSDINDNVTGFENRLTGDHGFVSYSNSFYDGKVTFNGRVRAKRDEVKFWGEGERLVPTTAAGGTFYNTDDPPPATSNNPGDFVYNQPLSNINLLQDGGGQLSFGLDFLGEVQVDTIYVELLPYDLNDPTNRQASPSEIADLQSLYSWSVYISDDQLTWFPQPMRPVIYDEIENRFEISFNSTQTPYMKIAVTPLPTFYLPGKEIRLAQLRPFRTLPSDTSEFTTTDVTTTFNINWAMSPKTTSGYDFIYRQEETDPFDEKRTLLSNGARLNHIFNEVFVGNLSLSRATVTERGQGDETGHLFSSSLMANYLPTFNQVLTYSFTHRDDEDEGSGTTNSLLLRNNLDLYTGWSLTLDGAYTMQEPAKGENSDSLFFRVGSNVTPNRWMNFSLFYDKRWTNIDGQAEIREESGEAIISWVPLASLSLYADFFVKKRQSDDTVTRQKYSVSWAPFRDGTLRFSIAYSIDNNSVSSDTTTLTPTIFWRPNKKTQLSLNYSIGKREDDFERVDFKTALLTLRAFY